MSELKAHIHPSGMTLRPVKVGRGVYVEWAIGYSEAEEKARARWRRFQSGSPLVRRDKTGWRFQSVSDARKVIRLFLEAEEERFKKADDHGEKPEASNHG